MTSFAFLAFLLLVLLVYVLVLFNVPVLVLKRLLVVCSLPGFLFIPQYLYPVYFACFLGLIIISSSISNQEKTGEVEIVNKLSKNKKKIFLLINSILLLAIFIYWLFWVQPDTVAVLALRVVQSDVIWMDWSAIYQDVVFHYDFLLLSLAIFVPVFIQAIWTLLSKKGKFK